MKRRTIIRLAIGLALLPIIVIVLFFAVFMAASAGSSTGSATLAAEWKTRLNQYSDLEASKADKDIVQIKFDNGEWLMGLAQGSHGIWLRGGGTIVLRDSKGKTRAFFGHVCSPGLLRAYLDELRTVDQYYSKLISNGFVEHFFE